MYVGNRTVHCTVLLLVLSCGLFCLLVALFLRVEGQKINIAFGELEHLALFNA